MMYEKEHESNTSDLNFLDNFYIKLSNEFSIKYYHQQRNKKDTYDTLSFLVLNLLVVIMGTYFYSNLITSIWLALAFSLGLAIIWESCNTFYQHFIWNSKKEHAKKTFIEYSKPYEFKDTINNFHALSKQIKIYSLYSINEENSNKHYQLFKEINLIENNLEQLNSLLKLNQYSKSLNIIMEFKELVNSLNDNFKDLKENQ